MIEDELAREAKKKTSKVRLNKIDETSELEDTA